MKSALFLAKYNALKPGSLAAYRTLKANESLPREELEKAARQKLSFLVNHAKANSPFYRDHFKELRGPIDLSGSMEAFAVLPILTRSHLRGSLDEILADGVSPSACNRVSTGGSTGEPVTVYHHKRDPRAAALWRMMTWWGVSPGSDIATAYREPNTGAVHRFKDRLVCWPQRRILLDACHLTDSSIAAWLDTCMKLKPPIVHGYVGAIAHVADYMLKRGLDSWNPKCVWVTSAPLTPPVRNTIQRAFQAPVFDQYGCCEIFYLACETPLASGLAVFSDLRHIEVVDENNMPVPDGVEGRILLTDLENLAFPLIRYEVGDRGAFMADQPEWELPFPRLSPVKGRESDSLTFPNGQCVSGEFWTTIFDDFPDAVSKFRVIQKADQSLRIEYVGGRSNEAPAELVRHRVSAMLEDCVPVTLAQVEEIRPDRGKMRYVVKESPRLAAQ